MYFISICEPLCISFSMSSGDFWEYVHVLTLVYIYNSLVIWSVLVYPSYGTNGDVVKLLSGKVGKGSEASTNLYVYYGFLYSLFS